MENYENDVFEFGNKPSEEPENFNYENISGLGESNYENEDLFDTMPSIPTNEPSNSTVEPINNLNINNYDYNLSSDNTLNTFPTIEPLDTPTITPTPTIEPMEVPSEEKPTIEPLDAPIQNNIDFNNIFETPQQPEVTENNMFEELPKVEELPEEVHAETVPEIPAVETPVEEIPAMETVTTDTVEEPKEETPVNSDIFYTGEDNNTNTTTVESITEDYNPVEESKAETNTMYSTLNDAPDIPMATTPISELEKLTEYEEEKIDTTDINSLFEKLSINVKDASDIFKKNTTLKQKIDSRFEELKKLQGELTNSRKKQMEEIDQYKDEVLNKLTEKKEEIEKRLNTLKELQASLEKEKTEFEEYKRTEQANISKIQKQVQSAYDERREELERIENVLRKQKDSLDEERNQLSLDKIQYESDKNDLANNLLKFNQIVDSFTNGIEMKEEE